MPSEEHSPRSMLHNFADGMRRQGMYPLALLQDMATQELVDCIAAAAPFVEAASTCSGRERKEATHVLAKMRAAISEEPLKPLKGMLDA